MDELYNSIGKEIAPGITKAITAEHSDQLIMAVAIYPEITPTENEDVATEPEVTKDLHGQATLRGLARIVTSREGNIKKYLGSLDLSELFVVDNHANPNRWEVIAPCHINGTDEVIRSIQPNESRFLGLEDPDMVVDDNGETHMFCTLPFTKDQKVYIYLGHAKGDLMNLHMEQPVLSPREVVADDGTQYIRGYKEFCPVPPNSEGIYHHLVESNIIRGEMWYSTIAAVKARDYDGPWEDEGDIIDPLKIKEKFADFVNSDDDYLWCGGHVSPCRILPSEFVDGGRFKMGIINGREKTVDGTFGKFRPGLFLYDPENGTIPWVDPRPLFDDPDAQTVIFASDVVIHKDKDNNSEQSATLITHIDDAYIQHYDISASTIKSRLPRNLTV